jgi:hypothetical protein
MRETWEPHGGIRRGKLGSLMEGSWRLRPSFICGVGSSFEDGALVEEGACLAGTSYTWRIADLLDSTWR